MPGRLAKEAAVDPPEAPEVLEQLIEVGSFIDDSQDGSKNDTSWYKMICSPITNYVY